MTRIVAGSARGRRLQVPNGAVRPTTDPGARSRLLDARPPTAAVVGGCRGDFFAGSGAMGLEAASRGRPPYCWWSRIAGRPRWQRPTATSWRCRGLSLLRADTWSIGPAGSGRAGAAAGRACGARSAVRRTRRQVARLLESLHRGGWFVDGAWALVERSARGKSFQWPAGWRSDVDRRYAETRIHLGQLVVSDE